MVAVIGGSNLPGDHNFIATQRDLNHENGAFETSRFYVILGRPLIRGVLVHLVLFVLRCKWVWHHHGLWLNVGMTAIRTGPLSLSQHLR